MTPEERLAAALKLLDEWLQTPYFSTFEEWRTWVKDFKPRVEAVLYGEKEAL